MKKFSWIFALILALSMAFVFAGCGEEPANPGSFDGQGPKNIDVLAGFIATFDADDLDGSGLVLANDDLGDYFARSGSPTLTLTDKSLKVTGCVGNGDYFGFTLLTEYFTTEVKVAPPFDLTFKGKLITPGQLKISMAGGPYGEVKRQAAAGAADSTFEITGTVTAYFLTANGDDGSPAGVRLQSIGGSVADFEITGITIVKK